jgi:hypothetical protein
LGYLTDEISPTDAANQLQAAVELAQLNMQQRPPGHPIFAALAAAQDALHRVQGEAMASAVNITPGTALWTIVDAALEGVYQAAALPDDPNATPKTIYQQIQSLPWPWVAAGLGLLGVGWYLFRGKR